MITGCSFSWEEISRTVGPCIRPGGSFLTKRAAEVCHLPADSRVADVGCGTGGTLEYLRQIGLHNTVGLDASVSLLTEGQRRIGPTRLVLGLAEALPFKDGSFDAIFCECVLSILEHKISALREFGRVLAGGGFLIMSDLFRESVPGMKSMGDILQKGLATKEDLVGTLRCLGFSMMLWEEHEKLLREFVARMILAGQCFPMPWGSRQGQAQKVILPRISYYLLIARKSGIGAEPDEIEGDGTGWTR